MRSRVLDLNEHYTRYLLKRGQLFLENSLQPQIKGVVQEAKFNTVKNNRKTLLGSIVVKMDGWSEVCTQSNIERKSNGTKKIGWST